MPDGVTLESMLALPLDSNPCGGRAPQGGVLKALTRNRTLAGREHPHPNPLPLAEEGARIYSLSRLRERAGVRVAGQQRASFLRERRTPTGDWDAHKKQHLGGTRTPSPQPSPAGGRGGRALLPLTLAGEGADLFTLPLPPRAAKGPCVALREGEGGSSQQGPLLKLLANQEQMWLCHLA